MTDQDRSQQPNSARLWLGLPEKAPAAQWIAAYWCLRNHLEARTRKAPTSRDRVLAHGQLHQLHRDFVSLEEIPAPLRPKPPLHAPVSHRPGLPARWAAAVVVILLLLAVAWTQLGQRPGASTPLAGAPAELILEANPPQAEVWVRTGEDERVVLTGPADGTPQTLPAGTYSISVLHPHCPDTWSQSIRLEADESRRYAPKICRGQGQIQVRSNVKQDRLIVDGRDLGMTGETLHSLRTGAHQVRVEKPGHVTWEGNVVLKPEQQIDLFAELPRSPSPQPAPAPAAASTAAAPRLAKRDLPAEAGTTRAAGRLNAPRTDKLSPIRTGKGGSKSWHDAVVEDLVGQYDQNGSGTLDTTQEVQAIPCATWIEIEQSYETGGLAVEMTHLYGFDGSDAPANTLGIAPAVRSYAYDRMKNCGLRARK
ncbi:MAG: PEGA domain-containing protein [Myxococcota bacterium]|nr:PEGA domain-containing protein [Myxococcota bacterium]